jgi:hypothetical protein
MSTRKALTKEAFFGANDRPIEPFELPEELYGEGAVVFLRPLDGEQRAEVEKKWTPRPDGSRPAQKDPAGWRWAMLLVSVVDEQGRPLFTDKDRSQVLARNAAVIDDLIDRICTLNGLTEESIEDRAKNSEGGQFKDSSSGSASLDSEDASTPGNWLGD